MRKEGIERGRRNKFELILKEDVCHKDTTIENSLE